MSSIGMIKGGRNLARFSAPQRWIDDLNTAMPAGEVRCANTVFKRSVSDETDIREIPVFIVKEPIPTDVLRHQGIISSSDEYDPVNTHFNWAIDFSDDMDEFYWFMDNFVLKDNERRRTLKYSPNQLAEVNGRQEIFGIEGIKSRISHRDKKWFETERPAVLERIEREKQEELKREALKKEQAEWARRQKEMQRAEEVAQWAGDW